MSRDIKPSRLRSLWAKYTEFKKPQLAYSTIHSDYRAVARIIRKLPADLSSAIAIRDWLLQNYAAETTRRLLRDLSACCQWAVRSELLDRNPFDGLNKDIRRKENATVWQAFTSGERDSIMEAFKQQDRFYLPWVQFLFWTGCRPEEAAGLRWEHIRDHEILFREALPNSTKVRQRTKTRRNREFPTNPRLQALLKELRPVDCTPKTAVFRGVRGGTFDYHNFQTRHWRAIVETLAEKGTVAIYLSEYHCRHTFITLALDAGMEVRDVAYLTGTSATIIWKHYASRSRNLHVPEF